MVHRQLAPAAIGTSGNKTTTPKSYQRLQGLQNIQTLVPSQRTALTVTAKLGDGRKESHTSRFSLRRRVKEGTEPTQHKYGEVGQSTSSNSVDGNFTADTKAAELHQAQDNSAGLNGNPAGGVATVQGQIAADQQEHSAPQLNIPWTSSSLESDDEFNQYPTPASQDEDVSSLLADVLASIEAVKVDDLLSTNKKAIQKLQSDIRWVLRRHTTEVGAATVLSRAAQESLLSAMYNASMPAMCVVAAELAPLGNYTYATTAARVTLLALGVGQPPSRLVHYIFNCLVASVQSPSNKVPLDQLQEARQGSMQEGESSIRDKRGMGLGSSSQEYLGWSAPSVALNLYEACCEQYGPDEVVLAACVALGLSQHQLLVRGAPMCQDFVVNFLLSHAGVRPMHEFQLAAQNMQSESHRLDAPGFYAAADTETGNGTQGCYTLDSTSSGMESNATLSLALPFHISAHLLSQDGSMSDDINPKAGSAEARQKLGLAEQDPLLRSADVQQLIESVVRYCDVLGVATAATLLRETLQLPDASTSRYLSSELLCRFKGLAEHVSWQQLLGDEATQQLVDILVSRKALLPLLLYVYLPGYIAESLEGCEAGRSSATWRNGAKLGSSLSSGIGDAAFGQGFSGLEGGCVAAKAGSSIPDWTGSSRYDSSEQNQSATDLQSTKMSWRNAKVQEFSAEEAWQSDLQSRDASIMGGELSASLQSKEKGTESEPPDGAFTQPCQASGAFVEAGSTGDTLRSDGNGLREIVTGGFGAKVGIPGKAQEFSKKVQPTPLWQQLQWEEDAPATCQPGQSGRHGGTTVRWQLTQEAEFLSVNAGVSGSQRIGLTEADIRSAEVTAGAAALGLLVARLASQGQTLPLPLVLAQLWAHMRMCCAADPPPPAADADAVPLLNTYLELGHLGSYLPTYGSLAPTGTHLAWWQRHVASLALGVAVARVSADPSQYAVRELADMVASNSGTIGGLLLRQSVQPVFRMLSVAREVRGEAVQAAFRPLIEAAEQLLDDIQVGMDLAAELARDRNLAMCGVVLRFTLRQAGRAQTHVKSPKRVAYDGKLRVQQSSINHSPSLSHEGPTTDLESTDTGESSSQVSSAGSGDCGAGRQQWLSAANSGALLLELAEHFPRKVPQTVDQLLRAQDQQESQRGPKLRLSRVSFETRFPSVATDELPWNDIWQAWDPDARWPGRLARQQHVIHMLMWHMAQCRRVDLVHALFPPLDFKRAPPYIKLLCLEAAYAYGNEQLVLDLLPGLEATVARAGSHDFSLLQNLLTKVCAELHVREWDARFLELIQGPGWRSAGIAYAAAQPSKAQVGWRMLSESVGKHGVVPSSHAFTAVLAGIEPANATQLRRSAQVPIEIVKLVYGLWAELLRRKKKNGQQLHGRTGKPTQGTHSTAGDQAVREKSKETGKSKGWCEGAPGILAEEQLYLEVNDGSFGSKLCFGLDLNLAELCQATALESGDLYLGIRSVILVAEALHFCGPCEQQNARYVDSMYEGFLAQVLVAGEALLVGQQYQGVAALLEAMFYAGVTECSEEIAQVVGAALDADQQVVNRLEAIWEDGVVFKLCGQEATNLVLLNKRGTEVPWRVSGCFQVLDTVDGSVYEQIINANR